MEQKRREAAKWTTKAGGAATGTNRITLSRRAGALGGGDRGHSAEEMADSRVEEAGEEEISMAESATGTTTTKITITATSIVLDVEMEAPATNV